MNTKFTQILSLITFYSLAFTFIIPTQIFAENFPANSVFNQNKNQINQTKNPQVDKSFGNIPVYFEQNNGQFNDKVKYFARGTSGYSLFLTATEAVYVLQSSKSQVSGSKSVVDELEPTKNQRPNAKDQTAVAVYMKLVGANENPSSVGLEQMPHKTNYFKGSDESKWRTEIPNFRQIQINNVYQGIDAVWHGKENGGVQYDFVVKPNANPNQIEWKIEGAQSVELNGKGTDLLIKTEHGTIRQQKPFTYQETNGFKQEVESNFRLEQKPDNSYLVKFEVGNYDRSKTLTIDPSVSLSNLNFSTFLGGDLNDFVDEIAVDRAGNVYVTGYTASSIFPTSAGTFDTSENGDFDGFVTKLNASGSDLLYSTYIGGSDFDRGNGLKVDISGNAYIAGETESANFPTTSGVVDTTHNGNRDAFIMKLNATGSTLDYSTFIGGNNPDRVIDLELDSLGNTFITGETLSTNYPTTGGVVDTSFNGVSDAFVTKVNPSGTALIYSTFLGGGDGDSASGIAIDSAGNAYVAGITSSTTVPFFPRTSGVFQFFSNGGREGFVSKLNPTGSALSYSTFIGGGGDDTINDIAVDRSGNAYITGATPDSSPAFPTTAGAFDTTQNGFNDAFVTKFNADGSGLIYSTFLGASNGDSGNKILLDSDENAYIGGGTDRASFPTTGGAYDATHNGDNDGFLSIMNSTGTAIRYSTFFGSSSSEDLDSIAIDSEGNVFIAGTTTGDVPITSGVFQPFRNGSGEIFVSKLGDLSIAGRTVDYDGSAIPNVRIALSGSSSGFVLSDAEGFFSFSNTNPGNFAVSATRPLYQFNPGTFQFETLPGNQNLTFVGQPVSSGPTATLAPLGGKVQSTAGNVGLPNTKLTLIDTVNGDVNVVTTDANGNYEFEAVTTGMFYIVVAEREGYNFAPQIFEINHFEKNLSLDFLASPNAPRPVDDFDGDGKTDFAVFRPENGVWYILNSQDNSLTAKQFGIDGDVPVASDYDGDNKADIAVYRPTTGNWYRLNSSNGEFKAIHFGANGDLPVQADFDGDGKTDLAVYRPSTGVWHKLNSSDGQYSSTKFGIETDVPVAADYDADGKADLSVFRDGIWYQLRSSDNQVKAFQFGLEGDKPQVGDFDGDGRMDTAVYRPSNGAWYWLESSDGDFQAKQFGNSTDIPTPADYNGDGRFEQAIFRDGTWFILRNDNSFYSAQFGQPGDVPIP